MPGPWTRVDTIIQHSFLCLVVCSVFPQDELCLLSPTFSPKMVFVGKMSVHIPLGFNLSRPVRITVSDVMVIAKVGADHLSPEVRSGWVSS